MPMNKWLGLNNYNKFKTNKNKLIGWTIPHFFCEGQAYNALDDPEETHCSIQVCSLQAHVKRAERRGQTFASASQKKHCECICKYTRKIREHNVSLVIIGFQGRRREAVTHHQHTYNMHQVRLLKAVRWAPALEGTPSNGPGTSPYHHTPQEQGFLQLFTRVFNSPERAYALKRDFPTVASTRNWGPMLARTRCPGEELDHSIQLQEQGDHISSGGKIGSEDALL